MVFGANIDWLPIRLSFAVALIAVVMLYFINRFGRLKW